MYAMALQCMSQNGQCFKHRVLILKGFWCWIMFESRHIISYIDRFSCNTHPVHSPMLHNCMVYKSWAWPMGCTRKNLPAFIVTESNYKFKVLCVTGNEKCVSVCAVTFLWWVHSHFPFLPYTNIHMAALFILLHFLLFVCFTIVCNLMS